MHDGQAVGIDRSFRLLGHEVVHHAEKAGGEEKTHGIMPVPPLHHGVNGAGVGRVGLRRSGGQGGAVDDVEHRHSEDEGAIEPVGDEDVGNSPLDDGAEEHDGVGDPDHGDQQIDGPFQFRVLLPLGPAHRQRNGRQQDDQLPPPENKGGEPVAEQAGMAGSLDHIERGAHQRAAAEGEDDGIGVQRAQPAVAEPRQIEVERGPEQLSGDEHARHHSHQAPNDGCDGELANDAIIVGFARMSCLHGGFLFLMR